MADYYFITKEQHQDLINEFRGLPKNIQNTNEVKSIIQKLNDFKRTQTVEAAIKNLTQNITPPNSTRTTLMRVPSKRNKR